MTTHFDIIPSASRTSVRTWAPLERRAGAIVVLIALLLPVLMIVVGFSVDLAHIQRVRTEMRAVADLSAKAAVGELSRTQDIGKARKAAKDVAKNNYVAGQILTLQDADIVFGRSDKQPDGTWAFQAGVNPLNSVRVFAKRANGSVEGPVGLFFGQFYGRTNFEQNFSATASFLDVDVCLVLDRSSSMKLATTNPAGGMSESDPRTCMVPQPDSRWIALENAVAVFVNKISTTLAAEHVAVVTFASDDYEPCGETNTTTSVDLDLTSDVNQVNAAMTARSTSIWNGNTRIDAGISQGRAVLTGPLARSYASKVMIVLTDGVYTGADPVPEATLAADDSIVVHTITFGDGANQIDMQAVAQAGGGNHYHAPDPAALNAIFGQIAGAIGILTE